MKKIVASSSNVICGFPGIGKEYLGMKHPERITNINTDTYAWLTPTIRNPKFPQNYIDAVRESKGLVLVSSHKDVRECLSKNKVNYSTCYPRLDCKHSYLKRYRLRGSPEAFVLLMDIMWSDWHRQIREDNRSIANYVLASHEYISDIVAID